VRIPRSLLFVLGVPFSLVLLACSSVRAEKGPFLDDDWLEPADGATGRGGSGTNTGATTGSGGTTTGSGGSAGGSGASGPGGATTGSGGAGGSAGGGGAGKSGSTPSCQPFDYSNYQAPAGKLTLKADIMPIFLDTATASCVLSVCHGNSAPNAPKLGPSNGMVDAAGLDAIRNALLAPSTQAPSLKIVDAGKPEDSYLLHKLDGTFTTANNVSKLNCMGLACQGSVGCGERMPQLLGKLPADKIGKIRDWIKQGAAAM
jgi:hypothetical protein